MTEALRHDETRIGDTEELVRALFSALNAHDLDGMVARWHPQLEAWFVALDRHLDRAGVRAQFADIFAACPDFTIDIQRLLVHGDRAATIEWRATGTHSGAPFEGIHTTGRSLELHGVDIMEFQDGLLRRNHVYYDGLAVARGLGVLPPEGSPADRGMLALFNVVAKLRQRLRRGSA